MNSLSTEIVIFLYYSQVCMQIYQHVNKLLYIIDEYKLNNNLP